MAIDRRDEALLDRAESLPVDAVAMAETFGEIQEREDDLSYEMEVQVTRSLSEAVRLDVFRVLAIACKDELTLKRFMESLGEDRVREQFDSIADPDERADCVREVFDDIAEEAVDAVLSFDERYADLDPRKKKYRHLVRRYVVMLAERHGVTKSGEEENEKPTSHRRFLSKTDERALLKDAAVAGVRMDAVIAAFRDLEESDNGDGGDEPIATPDALGSTAFFDVLDALSEVTGGTITMKGFRDAKHHDDVRAALFRLDRADRRMCLQSLVYEIAQEAVMRDARFQKALDGRIEQAELIASKYALQLIHTYS